MPWYTDKQIIDMVNYRAILADAAPTVSTECLLIQLSVCVNELMRRSVLHAAADDIVADLIDCKCCIEAPCPCACHEIQKERPS